MNEIQQFIESLSTVDIAVLSACGIAGIAVGAMILKPAKKGKRKPNRNNPKTLVFYDEYRNEYMLDNITRGIAVFGSSGSGKTASVIESLGEHYAKYKMGGIINDYKDFELTEVLYPRFQKAGVPYYVFSIGDVNRSVRLNPLDDMYLKSTIDITAAVNSLILNLSKGDPQGAEGFFREGSASLLSGIIIRLKKVAPERCNLPFVIALLLATENHHEEVVNEDGSILIKPFQKLIRFLNEDPEAAQQASVFLSGIASEKQTAALYSTLASYLRVLCAPELFYLLSENEIPLDVNSDEHKSVIAFINKPGNVESVISPINAMLIQTAFTAMSERGRYNSFILLDEAPTIRVENLGRKISTLRSYNICFAYVVQDMVQLLVQYGGKAYYGKEIFANLSYQFMGKANDADTTKHYEKYFELIKERQVSVSQKSTVLGDADRRVTTSERERSKRRACEFFALEQGEFVMFADGEDYRLKFWYEEPKKELPPERRNISRNELQKHFQKILDDAATFLPNHFDKQNKEDKQ